MIGNLKLIALDWTRKKDPPLSLGHASILANLKHHRIEVHPRSWSVNSSDFRPADVTQFIMHNAQANTHVALGAFVWNEKAIQSILHDLKKYKFPGRIIIGGPQVSYVKNNIESYYPQADIFIRGYAENALVKLMQSTEKMPAVKGIHYAGMPDLQLSAVADLNTLPSPFLAGIIAAQRFIRWETQRGCPFHCSFCQHRESDVTMKRRHFNIERITEEAQWIARNKVIQDVAVLDPTFNSGPNYLSVLDTLIQERFSGKLSLQCRIEMIKTDFLDRVSELNKTGKVVLEFGLQTIHANEQRLIDRVSNMKLIEKNLEEVKKRNIETEVSLIFGLPNQTLASFIESVEYCKKQQFPVIHAFPLMLLRGTELHNQKQHLGLVESDEVAAPEIDRIQADIPHVISSPSFSYGDWKEMSRIAASLETYNANNASITTTSSKTIKNVFPFWNNINKNKVNIEEPDTNIAQEIILKKK